MPQGWHHFAGRIGDARQCCSGRDRTIVIVRGMGLITIRIVTRRQAPAFGTVTGIAAWIGDTMRLVDPRLRHILQPIIGMRVGKAMWIKATKGIMRKEQRTAETRSKRQRNSVIDITIAIIPPGAKSLLVDFRRNSMTGRGCRQYIGDQALVPAADGVIHTEAVLRAPMPCQDALARLDMPGPLHRLPQRGDARP